MSGRRVLLYFSWSRPAETGAPLTVIEDRFPAVFELRRIFYPKFEGLARHAAADQSIAGFLDHVQKPNFAAFAELAGTLTGHAAVQAERVRDDGSETLLDAASIADADAETIVVISFDSLRTRQQASDAEVQAVRQFLDHPDHLIFVCPHHDIGAEAGDLPSVERALAEYLHHGDPAIPPRQGFGGYSRSLLARLGVPVMNRYGLRPGPTPDGAPAPAEIDRTLDKLGLLDGVEAFNLHAHLPQLERVGTAVERLDVLARQTIDPAAPPHPYTRAGRSSFDALLQSRPDAFAGTLLVCDTTMFSSTAGGADQLRQLWHNVLSRPRRHASP